MQKGQQTKKLKITTLQKTERVKIVRKDDRIYRVLAIKTIEGETGDDTLTGTMDDSEKEEPLTDAYKTASGDEGNKGNEFTSGNFTACNDVATVNSPAVICADNTAVPDVGCPASLSASAICPANASDLNSVHASAVVSYLLIDCLDPKMPLWADGGAFQIEEPVMEADYLNLLPSSLPDDSSLTPDQKKEMYRRYNAIAGIVPFIADADLVSRLIKSSASLNGISTQSVRRYLYKYLVYQDVRCLSPVLRVPRGLNDDEKNFRWALNRFYYNKHKNTLQFAYIEMLKAKYTDKDGKLKEDYPSFFRFRYFYRKTRTVQNEVISREGLKAYQRDYRPLLGDGVQEYCPVIGTGMLDSTICDIYLVNERNEIVGRPVLTACIDAYSGLCCGYGLGWEGGVYSIKNLMLNIITDKVEHCRKYGIAIKEEQWSCRELPRRFVTDKGAEYASENFTQMTDLGIEIVNLDAYRPELKGPVEKFFDIVQDYFKPYLKGKGTIEPDYQERGAHDYRKDAALTLRQFETILLHCIIFYNSSRVMEDYPMTKEMLDAGIKPIPSEVWNYGRDRAELIKADKEAIRMTLMPRTEGRFTRFGLKVNKLRYKNEESKYRECYLQGGKVTVACDKEDIGKVWVMEDGRYVEFDLIESRYTGLTIDEMECLKERQRMITQEAQRIKLQAQVDLSGHLHAVRNQADGVEASGLKNIRETRKRERREEHMKKDSGDKGRNDGTEKGGPNG